MYLANWVSAGLGVAAMAWVAACGGGSDASESEATPPAVFAAPTYSPLSTRSPVQDPAALAVIPCAGQPLVAGEPAPSCVLVIGGGKRLLFGAPTGTAQSLSREDLRHLDAVFLFSLASEDIEGLDDVRRASWAAGRAQPLQVFGPDGTGETVASLNRMHVYGDAITALGSGTAGFDTLPLTPADFRLSRRAGDVTNVLFTTGDLNVSAISAEPVRAGYLVRYGLSEAHTIALWPCPLEQGFRDADLTLAPAQRPRASDCSRLDTIYGGQLSVWPSGPDPDGTYRRAMPIFVTRTPAG